MIQYDSTRNSPILLKCSIFLVNSLSPRVMDIPAIILSSGSISSPFFINLLCISPAFLALSKSRTRSPKDCKSSDIAVLFLSFFMSMVPCQISNTVIVVVNNSSDDFCNSSAFLTAPLSDLSKSIINDVSNIIVLPFSFVLYSFFWHFQFFFLYTDFHFQLVLQHILKDQSFQ